MTLDFFARQSNLIDHLAPVWKAFPPDRRGTFWVNEKIADYARQEIGECTIFDGASPGGDNPILVCSYGDLRRAAYNEKRKIIHMEHGTGHSFGGAPYPNGEGIRDRVDLFLMPNEYTSRLSRTVRPDHRHEVIGTPKTDPFVAPLPAPLKNPGSPMIAIGFHWGDGNSSPPESGTAFEHYKSILPILASRYNMIGYGHPLGIGRYRPHFEAAGIEVVDDFREVVKRADVCINDLSSVMYEFLLTGKPVIVLNAPWFRRDVHFGIRFWDYSMIGVNIELAAALPSAIQMTLDCYETVHLHERRLAVADLYPYLGKATERAVEVLCKYLGEVE